MIISKKTILKTLLLAAISCSPQIALASDTKDIKFVSWNVEHLAENNGEGCRPRNDQDYAKLRMFAEKLDADVISLQEVESKKAVHRVFPKSDWQVVMSDRPASAVYECRGSGRQSTQQKVAIAIRNDIDFKPLSSFKKLGLGMEGLRYGVSVRLNIAKQPLDVLAVHLKSGCFVDNYQTADRKACKVLSKQVPILDNWVEERLKQDKAFVIMGDFNHRLAAANNRLWQDLTAMQGQPVWITNTMSNLLGCHPKYPAPIDHILLSPQATTLLKSGSEKVHLYGESRSRTNIKDMLSDHCPISMVLLD